MARSNNPVKFMAAAVAVVGVAFCAGYFLIGGTHTTPTAPENIVTPSPTQSKPAPAKPSVAAMTPRVKNSDYSAPNAPRIQIVEEKTPSLLDTSKLQPQPGAATPSTTDPEASQEATPPTPIQTPAPSPDASATSSDGTDTAPPAPDADTTTATPLVTVPDPDVEQPGNPASEPAASPDGTGNKPQYRVQTGSFVTSDNAQALADALRRRGYATSTHTERDGDKTVYKVQVGAYHTRSAADKAAQDLQSSGYPADVTPINP